MVGSKILALVVLGWPAYLVAQAALGLWRRFRLLRKPVEAEAEVVEIHPRGVVADIGATVVDLRVAYAHGGRTYDLWVTRAGPPALSVALGDLVSVLFEPERPANVIDASLKPWDDVTGPLVFSVLLFFFLAWVLQLLLGWL